jgi:hypothetical protein
MNHAFTARTMSPVVAFLAALALLAAAVLTGMLATAGHDQAGAVWNKVDTKYGAVWN